MSIKIFDFLLCLTKVWCYYSHTNAFILWFASSIGEIRLVETSCKAIGLFMVEMTTWPCRNSCIKCHYWDRCFYRCHWHELSYHLTNPKGGLCIFDCFSCEKRSTGHEEFPKICTFITSPHKMIFIWIFVYLYSARHEDLPKHLSDVSYPCCKLYW